MKKWIFVLLGLLILFSGCLSASSNPAIASETAQDAGKKTLKGLQFHTALETAMEVAREQDKPVFVYARSEYCGWCMKFEGETFTNQSVIAKLGENFVLASIDVYEQKNETRSFRVRSTPAEIFLHSNGMEIRRIPGYIDTETFLKILDEVIYKEAEK